MKREFEIFLTCQNKYTKCLSIHIIRWIIQPTNIIVVVLITTFTSIHSCTLLMYMLNEETPSFIFFLTPQKKKKMLCTDLNLRNTRQLGFVVKGIFDVLISLRKISFCITASVRHELEKYVKFLHFYLSCFSWKKKTVQGQVGWMLTLVY